LRQLNEKCRMYERAFERLGIKKEELLAIGA